MFEIRKFAQTDSTNDDAALLLGAPEHAGAVLVAEYQRHGRGRHARAWIAPPGSSLLFTAILPHAIATEALWAVPFWTGLAVADGIEAATGERVRLQWPNDLLLDGRKCSGILCISRVAGERAFVGCGVGINVIRPSADAALDAIMPPPIFLSDRHAGATKEDLLDTVLAAFEGRLPELADPQAIARAWESRANLAGTRYRLKLDGAETELEAEARAIAADGSLVVRADDGTTHTIGLADARVMRG